MNPGVAPSSRNFAVLCHSLQGWPLTPLTPGMIWLSAVLGSLDLSFLKQLSTGLCHTEAKILQFVLFPAQPRKEFGLKIIYINITSPAASFQQEFLGWRDTNGLQGSDCSGMSARRCRSLKTRPRTLGAMTPTQSCSLPCSELLCEICSCSADGEEKRRQISLFLQGQVRAGCRKGNLLYL